MPWSIDQYSQDNKGKPRDDRIQNHLLEGEKAMHGRKSLND